MVRLLALRYTPGVANTSNAPPPMPLEEKECEKRDEKEDDECDDIDLFGATTRR
jgi:hypothetical protein